MRIALVVDATGSMAPDKAATLDAINEYIGELQAGKSTATAKFTLTTFNSITGVRVLRDAIPMKKVKPVKPADYICDDMTPLRDAVGSTIALMERGAPKKGNDKVMVTILTDGKENQSKEYSAPELKRLIRQKEETGCWSFVFLGADIDAWSAQMDMGAQVASAASTMSFSKRDLVGTMSDIAAGTVAYAASGARSTKSFRDYLHDPDVRMNTQQAAEYVGYSAQTLIRYKQNGTGPAYTQHVPHGKVVYSKADLDEWLRSKPKR